MNGFSLEKIVADIISDSDKQLILMLLILLWREKADKNLIMALAFVILF